MKAAPDALIDVLEPWRRNVAGAVDLMDISLNPGCNYVPQQAPNPSRTGGRARPNVRLKHLMLNI